MSVAAHHNAKAPAIEPRKSNIVKAFSCHTPTKCFPYLKFTRARGRKLMAAHQLTVIV
jgi:hypothetical protein